jgi:hypothetical protein
MNINERDERIELNRITLVELNDKRRELMTLIEAAQLLNRKGLEMPLIGIEAVLAEMWESYSILKNK